MHKGLFYNLVMKDALKYQTIKASGSREKSIGFGVGSIINSIFMIVFAGLTVFALDLASNGGSGVLGGVLLLILSIPGVLVSFLNALLKSIYQVRLNKKPIGYVALGIVLTVILGAVVVVIILSN